MKTKIFCDTADYKTIKQFNNRNIVEGFTTNPSLMRLAGAKNYREYCSKLLKVCKKKPISFEVFADDLNQMFSQALKINDWGKNIFVKIPVVNSKGIFTGPIIKKLSQRGVKLNITALYSYKQVVKVINCLNKKSKSIISIFAGRMADTGKDPLPILKKSISKAKKYKNIQILWASTREAYNYLQAKKLKCHIITMPPKIISQINEFGKSFNLLTIGTVKGFLKDSRKSKFKI
jgi:transaldolase